VICPDYPPSLSSVRCSNLRRCRTRVKSLPTRYCRWYTFRPRSPSAVVKSSDSPFESLAEQLHRFYIPMHALSPDLVFLSKPLGPLEQLHTKRASWTLPSAPRLPQLRCSWRQARQTSGETVRPRPNHSWTFWNDGGQVRS